jgi:hypothetical protein
MNNQRFINEERIVYFPSEDCTDNNINESGLDLRRASECNRIQNKRIREL